MGSISAKLQAGNALFSFGSFLYAETVLVGWAFALGALFGWLGERLGHSPRAPLDDP